MLIKQWGPPTMSPDNEDEDTVNTYIGRLEEDFLRANH